MKEDRIFEYKIEHTNTSNFRNLFEVLGQVLHELRLTHIKPLKPVRNDEDESNSEEENDDTENENSEDEKSEESEENSEESEESEDEKDTKSKSKGKKKEKELSKKPSQWDSNKKDQGGIKILEINDYKSIIVHVRLFAENFYKFECKYDNYTIGLEPQTMFNFIKNIDKEGVMTVYTTEAKKQIMNIELNNQEKKNKSTYEFKLMDLNENQHKIPPPQFDVMVEMKTDEFHNMCKEMHTHGKHMAIICTEKKIEFKCKGNSGIIKKEFENGGSVVISLKDNKDGKKSTEPKIISEIYDLQNITAFNKCRSLCTYIQLLLKNKYPMFIRYEVATLGVMQVGFVPVNEDNINKNMNYNEKNDQFYTEPAIKMKSL
jgi:proliferating cell nuclear antigen PCNA